LMPPGQSDGAMFEMGYADALGKDIVVSGPNTGRTIFTARGEEFDDDERAFSFIVDRYFSEMDAEDTL
jgi:nucleoside 2-deoxyribosyltransferase